MMSRISQRLLWVLLALLGMLGTWLLGSYQSQREVGLLLSELRADHAARQHQDQVTLVELQQKLDQVTRARDVADARSASLQQMLDGNLRQSSEDTAELALYRRIAGEDTPGGLWIDSITLAEGKTDVLEVTVVQSRGRNRATGMLNVTVIDSRGNAAELPPTPFDLRFFQTLLVKVDNVDTIQPEDVEVSITLENATRSSGTQRVRWAELNDRR